eukprot:Platyproteum_vivax@DN6793_c0_g1_i3.p1
MEIVHYFFVLWVTIAILQKTYWQMKMNYWQQKRFGFGCKQTLESLSLLQLVEAASVGLVVCLLVWPQSPLIAWNWFEVSVPVDVLFILMGCLSAYIMSEAHRPVLYSSPPYVHRRSVGFACRFSEFRKFLVFSMRVYSGNDARSMEVF